MFLTPLVFVVTVAVGVQDRPASAPSDTDGPWVSDYKLVGNPSFTQALSAIAKILFAYCGTAAFFSVVAEMKHPQHFTRSLILCQATISIAYVVIGIVVYYYCGSYVASPALGSAGPLLKKISYGIALPGLLVTAILTSHVSTPETIAI